MTPVNSFLYRPPRYPIHFPFPLVFTFGAHSIEGQCLNLSSTGLLAKFAVPMAAETIGVVRFQPAGYVMDIPSSVSHSEGFSAGLLFSFASREQEQLLLALVQVVRDASTLEN